MSLFVFTLVGFLFNFGSAFQTTVDAQGAECFHTRVEDVQSKLTLTYEVIEGGFLDIDVWINGPEGRIYSSEREKSGILAFSANVPGKYEACFNNTMSTVTTKVVKFDLVVEVPAAVTGKQQTLEEMLADLGRALRSAKKEQEYMVVRDQVHRRTNDSTNTRLMVFFAFEGFLMVAVFFMEIHYLERFFEVRHAV